MSSDPLLTTLCSVCRAQPPRYKCPQCVTRYCSVPCNRRHRARTGCSGIRDVTTFVPKSKLCTESGIDRDYNFLQRIETARFSTHKHVVDERRVLRQNDVKARVLGEDDQSKTTQRGRYNKNSRGGAQGGQNRKPQEPAALQKKWQGEELRYVPTRPRVPRLAEGDGSDAAAVCALAEPAASTHYEAATSQRVRALCRRNGIMLLGAPRGLARQRANITTVSTEWAAATASNSKQTAEVLLHWQVEWILHDQNDSLNGSKPAPVLRQLLDNVPLFRAYVSVVKWRQKQVSAPTAKLIAEEVEANGTHEMDTREDGNDTPSTKKVRRSSSVEGSADNNSFFFAYDVQNQNSSAWRTIVADSDAALDDAQLAAKYNLRYFLLRPRAPGAPPPPSAAGKGPVNELIPLDATDTLATALPGRSVLEFPTIYVLPAGTDDLPAGCVLGSTARRVILEEPASTASSKHGAKRPWEGGVNSAAKKRVQFAEQGADEESDTSSSGSDSSGEEESEEDDGEEADDVAEEEEEEDGELLGAAPAAVGLKGLPPLPGMEGVVNAVDAEVDDGKRKLVVYDSWSEGSDDE
ncbi:hit zinc finger [Ophiostoma piceae UAMH 11346]|uniref:Hit zinc finger n=1 Tax=Ophiostoma piceae (strain UAMH 11346) TaxID=1262450 RepID=S3D1H2_OPHP1|nr:hit zinc finger [Ophiostoma piceae UAMH 11346]